MTESLRGCGYRVVHGFLYSRGAINPIKRVKRVPNYRMVDGIRVRYRSGNKSGVNMRIAWSKQPLGQLPDLQLAQQLHVAENAVREQRRRRGIPAYYLARRRLFEEYAKEREETTSTAITWDYIAGFFDGEGCVQYGFRNGKKGRPYTHFRIQFTNTNREILEKIREFFGEGRVLANSPHGISKKTCYVLNLNGRQLLSLAEYLAGRCHIKATKLREGVAFIQYITVAKEKAHGKLPYTEYLRWLKQEKHFTQEQIGLLFNAGRGAVSSGSRRNEI